MPNTDTEMRAQADAVLKAIETPQDRAIRQQWGKSQGPSIIAGRVSRLGEAPAHDRAVVDATLDPLDFRAAVHLDESARMQQAVRTLGDLPSLRERLRQTLEITDALAKEGDPTAVESQALRSRAQKIKIAQGMVDELIGGTTPNDNLTVPERLEVLDLVVRSLDSEPAA